MYIVEKVITYRIRDNHTYSTIMSDLTDELIANRICLMANDQAEHSKVKLEAKEKELSELRSVLPQ